MISIADYELQFNKNENVYYVHSLENGAICPICNRSLTRKGWPLRKVIMGDGEKQKFKVQRYYCKACNKTHRGLFDVIVPYKRHCAETIEGIVCKTALYPYCEDSTIRRIKAWWIVMQLYIKSVLVAIRERYGIDLTKEKKLIKIVRALVNTHLWPGTRSALTPGKT